MPATLEVAKEIKVISSETDEQYLKKTFLRSEDEFQVDFKLVGENRFRINFWVQRNKNNDTIPDNFISRSFYVVLKKCGTEWSHTIK